METTTKQLTLREVLSHTPIRRLWLGQLVSIFGDFLAVFAVFSMVSFRLHGTPTQIAFILISFFLPLAVVGPVAGVFVDRWNIKQTMIASDLVRAVLALLLVFVSSTYQIYAILLALSTVSTFFMPAQSVTIRTIVPKEGLLGANALMAQAFHVMQIAGPAAAGVLISWAGEKTCFYLDSLSFVFSALMISTLRIERTPSSGGQDLRSTIADLTSGAKFIFTHSTLSFIVASMAAGMFAIRCFGALLAVYVRDILKAGAGLFGTLGSLVGVGMILGTQMVNKLARNRSKSRLVVTGLIGIGAAISLMAAIGNVVITLLSTLALGFCIALILVPAQTVMQQETPSAMLGRVSSSFMSVLSISQIAALTLAGPTAQAVGIRNLYYASALFILIIAWVGYRRLPVQGAKEALRS